jgi:single-strand DNA-binding protein
MATITAVTVAGNLTRDPEIRYTRDGQATTSLSVAVNRRWQNQQTKEWEESVSFLDVVCWRDLAENVALSLITRCSGRQHPKRPGYLLCGHVR